MKRIFATALTALLLALPAGAEIESVSTDTAALTITVDGTPLTAQEGGVVDGTCYVTLRGLHRVLEGTSLHWDGTAAFFSRGDFTLTAQPNQPYFEINDRALHVEGGIWVPNGYTALPIRLIAEALNGTAVWDGETGTVALTTGILQPEVASYDNTDLFWLSSIISAESRGEGLEGQMAVGNVVLNRLAHWRYPDNIYGVIFDQNYGVQFEPISNGTIYDSPTDQSILAAKLVLEGIDVVGDALYFFAPALSEGTWIRGNTQYVTTIGCHQFYRDWS